MENKNGIINKKKVLISTLFVPLAIPLTGLFVGLMDIEDFFAAFFGFAILGLIWGAVIWIPTILICLLIEVVAIQKNSTPNVVVIILILEAIGAWFAIHGFFDLGFDEIQFSVILALAIASTQGIRILYLFTKDRIYNDPQNEGLTEIIDD